MKPTPLPEQLTRREALRRLGAFAALAPLAPLAASCQPSPPQGKAMNPNEPPAAPAPAPVAPLPAVFLPHGGGPWPFMDDRVFGTPGMWDAMRAYMERLSFVPPRPPKAVLLISAHWEAPVPTVMTAAKPPMLYDYSGFPPETYTLQWPAPGHVELAGRVRELLEAAGISAAADPARGFDHGTFVPLLLAWPQADMPTFQLSLQAGLDPLTHLRIGQALAPLRQEGVFIVGSGMSYHNMHAFGLHMRGQRTSMRDDSLAFEEWLAETLSLEPDRRHTRLVEWERAPSARACHPREEHLLPLMVVAGSALEAPASLPYRDVVLGAHVAAAHFG